MRPISNAGLVCSVIAALVFGFGIMGCNDSDSDNDDKAETTWYQDVDKDGFGDPSVSITQKKQPEGYVVIGGDLMDNDPGVNPGAEEICDGRDNNCNGMVDENGCQPAAQTISGHIANMAAATPYFTPDASLQLVLWPEDGRPPFTTDDQGRRVYTSTLAEIFPVPGDGVFEFHTTGLAPGEYAIAAQRLSKDYSTQTAPLLSLASGPTAIIVIPQNAGQKLEIPLGDVTLPAPPPVDDDTTIPNPPSGVSASDGDFEDRVRVTWNAVPEAVSYEIFRAASFSGQKLQIATVTATAYEDTTVPCGVEYYYWVRSVNAVGASELFYNDMGFKRCPLPPVDEPEEPKEPDDPDEPENPVDKPVVLSAPTGTTASDGAFPEKIQISWHASASATAYDVYRCPTCCGEKTKIGTTSALVFDDTDVPLHSYFYWIKANNATSTSEFSLYDTGYTMTRPPAPTGVSASDGVYSDRILITWNQTPTAAYYLIYRSRCTGYNKVCIGQTVNITFLDTDLQCSMDNFIYSIKSVNAAGISNSSGDDQGYVYRPLPAPNNVFASDGSDPNCVTITWNEVINAKRYEIYRATSLDGEKERIGSVDYPKTFFSDSSVTCPLIYFYWVRTIDHNNYISCKFSNYDTGYCAEE